MSKTIAGYLIKQEIYEGRDSCVYRGLRLADKQSVILKLLNYAYPSPERIARFKLEYAITCSFQRAVDGAKINDAVVRAYDLLNTQDRWAIVLEDFGGVSLEQYLHQRPLPIGEFLALAIQIVECLEAVQHNGIIHKDVNPANLVFNQATGQLKIIDFGLSTQLSQENPTLWASTVLEGTLAYLSPEQTGRMNRVVDYRSDFYALGVTFYQMLTGQLPFTTTDPLALVHSHLAQPPRSPQTIQPDIPAVLADIVLKLMAKNAEDRYQTTHGILFDLRESLRQYQSYAHIQPFPLAKADITGRLQLAPKLYGREAEIALLHSAFQRISEGAHEVVMVAGYTGIGKSALVQELYPPLAARRGYFVSGKFDQFQRNTPYASLIQAVRALVRQLLAEDEKAIGQWRHRLQSALGANGRVLSDVIPEMALLIGEQPPLPELSPTEAQNRFYLVFRNFIYLFAQPEHPLVLLLDDLQWADSASLKFLEELMKARDSAHLLVLGTYRSNEVTDAHPLVATLEQIRNAQTPVHQIELAPLTLPNIVDWLADSFSCAPSAVHDLAQLVMTKTGGNPFFVNEFLKFLDSKKLITFDVQNLVWQWNILQIQQSEVTDNIADLMAQKVSLLAPKTQQVVMLAALVGNQFDLQTLALLHERPLQATAVDLWEALAAGLIVPLNDTYQLATLDVQGLAEAITVIYKFAHDQIQTAAYALIPVAERHALHWRAGQILLQQLPPERREQNLFDIVNLLNVGRDLAGNLASQLELAELNLQACRRAKRAAAYQAAFKYARIGLALVPQRGWIEQYALTLALHLEVAETAYLTTNFAEMERIAALVLQRAQTTLDKISIYEIKIEAFIAYNQLADALQTGIAALKLLNVHFPSHPARFHALVGFAETKMKLVGRKIEDLAALPVMGEAHRVAAMQILGLISSLAYISAPNLFPLTVFKQINLSLTYGNTTESAFAYALYGISLCGIVGDIEGGYQFGQLALRLLDQFNAQQLKSKTWMAVYHFIVPWRASIRSTTQPLLEAHYSGLATGDFAFAATTANVHNISVFYCGGELSALQRQLIKHGELIKELKQERLLHIQLLTLQAVNNLQNDTENPWCLVGTTYDETQMLPIHLAVKDANTLAQLFLCKLVLAYLFQAYPAALASMAQLETYKNAITGVFYVAVFNFYDSLTRLATAHDSTPAAQKQLYRRVASNQKKLRKWANFAPMNFRHKWFLVQAELARVQGQKMQARTYYDQAIDLARQNEYYNEAALACELAGQFYLNMAQERLAQYYLHDALYLYNRWGAHAKVTDLERRYPHLLVRSALLSPRVGLTPTTTSSGQSAVSLDLTSVLKASQAISGEIKLEKLLEKLMKIVIENAGAQRGFLLLERKGRWTIETEGVLEKTPMQEDGAAVTTLRSVPAAESEHVSLAIINYVARTCESVVLDDATQDALFAQDAYIRQTQPKSVLCTPLINQGKLTAILYLENNLTTNAFTAERLEVLNLLSAQAAISIENARLYSHQVALTDGYSRFVPQEILHFLQKESIVDVKLGDQVQQEMAILVSDVRSFTTLSETMTPQENFDFVNAYLGRVSPIVREHGGLIVKYMGDGMMAVFPTRAEDALHAAFDKLRAVELYNATRAAHGYVPLQIGIGIHTGKMMLGTVGEPERMQSDLLSDAVNLTARLEGLTKEYGATLIISQEFLHRLSNPAAYQMRFLGKAQVKGRQAFVTIYEVFGAEPREQIAVKIQTKADFEAALTLFFEQRFAEAKELFQRVLQHDPQDKAAALYVQRTMQALQPSAPRSSVEIASPPER